MSHGFITYQIKKFWDDEFKSLEYVNEPFNDPGSVEKWRELGFQGKICGDMADMRGRQPSWNHRFIEIYQALGWLDIGTSYYRMTTDTVMPQHRDLYKAYIQRFQLQGQERTIRRALVFLEDWKQGHYFDCGEQAVVNWKAGDVVEWTYDTPHSAANIGVADRYTLQITGHVDD
jgi:hypothetical protein